MKELLTDTLARALRYCAALPTRRVTPDGSALEALGQLDVPLPDAGLEAADVLAELDSLASPATVSSTGGRYLGFVTGGSLPATVAAGWLAAVWDQNAAYQVMSPASAALERVAAR